VRGTFHSSIMQPSPTGIWRSWWLIHRNWLGALHNPSL